MKTRRHAKTLLSPPSSRRPHQPPRFRRPLPSISRHLRRSPLDLPKPKRQRAPGRNATSRYDCLDYHARAQDGWSVLVLTDNDTLDMPEIGLSIPLAEFYEGLSFETAPAEDNENDPTPPAGA